MRVASVWFLGHEDPGVVTTKSAIVADVLLNRCCSGPHPCVPTDLTLIVCILCWD